MNSTLSELVTTLTDRVNKLELAVRRDSQALYSNAKELKAGLDAAEFNLRAHQKVINGLTRELHSFAEDGLRYVDTHEVVMGEKKETHVNWAVYHKYVEDDIAKLLELEKKRDRDDKLQQVALIETNGIFDKVRETVLSQVTTEEDGATRESEIARVTAFFEEYTKQVSLLKEGAEYDSGKLGTAIRLIFSENAAIKKAAAENVPEVSEAPHVSPVENEPVVFGG